MQKTEYFKDKNIVTNKEVKIKNNMSKYRE